jgi:hypothetical protein
VRTLLFLFVGFLVNLPYAHETWTDHKITDDGHDVVATVIDARSVDGRYLVDYRLPKSEDPAGTRFSASVDARTHELAEQGQVIGVRVLAGKPSSNRPDGLVASSLFKVIAIVGDVVLVLIAVLSLYRRRHPGDMPDPRPRPVGL